MLGFIFTLLSGLYMILRIKSEMEMNGDAGAFNNQRLVRCTDQKSTNCSSSLNDIQFLTFHTDVLVDDLINYSNVHEMTIIAAQHMSMDELSLMMHNVSDPSSLNYGQHWTKNEVAELTSSKKVHNAVVSYLILHGESILCKTMDDEDQEMESYFVVALWGRAFNTDFYYQDAGDSDDNTSSDYVRKTPLSTPRSKIPARFPSCVPSELSSKNIFHSPASSVPTYVSSEPKSFSFDDFLRSTLTSSSPTANEYPSSDETSENRFEPSLSPSPATTSSTSPPVESSSPPSLSLSLPSSTLPTTVPLSETGKPHHVPSGIPTPVPGDPTMNPTASYVSILQASQVRS